MLTERLRVVDKHTLPLQVLREYGVDLTVPHEAEFDIVAPSIDETPVAQFAKEHDCRYELQQIDGACLATLNLRDVSRIVGDLGLPVHVLWASRVPLES